MQLDLFSKPQKPKCPIEEHRYLWKICWNWDGPTVGGYCEVHTPIVRTTEGNSLYCYMERCRLIENKGSEWIAEIDMPDFQGESWEKNGTQIILGILDIWPPIIDLK